MVKNIIKLLTSVFLIIFLMLSHDAFAMRQISKIKPRPGVIPKTPASQKPAQQPGKIIPDGPKPTASTGQSATEVSTSSHRAGPSVSIKSHAPSIVEQQSKAVAQVESQNHIGNALVIDLISHSKNIVETFTKQVEMAQAQGMQVGIIHRNSPQTLEYILSLTKEKVPQLTWKQINHVGLLLLEFIILPDNTILLFISSLKDFKPFLIDASSEKLILNPYRYTSSTWYAFSSNSIPADILQSITNDLQGKEFLEKKITEAQQQLEIKAQNAILQSKENLHFYRNILKNAKELEIGESEIAQYDNSLDRISNMEKTPITPQELNRIDAQFLELAKDVLYAKASGYEMLINKAKNIVAPDRIEKYEAILSQIKQQNVKSPKSADLAIRTFEQLENILEPTQTKETNEKKLIEQKQLEQEVADLQKKQNLATESTQQARDNLAKIEEQIKLQQKKIEQTNQEITQFESQQKELSTSLTEQQNEILKLQQQKKLADKQAQAQKELAALKEKEIEAQKTLENALDEQIAQMKAKQEAEEKLKKSLKETQIVGSKKPSTQPTEPIEKVIPEPGIQQLPAGDLPERHIEAEIRARELEEARLLKQQQKEEAQKNLEQAKQQLLQAKKNAADKTNALELIQKNQTNIQSKLNKAEQDLESIKLKAKVQEEQFAQRNQEFIKEQENATAQQQAEIALKQEALEKQNNIDEATIRRDRALKEEAVLKAQEAQKQIEQSAEKARQEKEAAEKAVLEAQATLTSAEKQIWNITKAQKDLNSIIEMQARQEQLAREQLSEIKHPGEITGVKKESSAEIIKRLENERNQLLEEIRQNERKEREKIEENPALQERIEIPGGGGNNAPQNNQPIVQPPFNIPSIPMEPALPPLPKPSNEEEEETIPTEEIEHGREIIPPRKPSQIKPSVYESASYERKYTQPSKPLQPETESFGNISYIPGPTLPAMPLNSHAFPEEPLKTFQPNIPRGSWTPAAPAPSFGGGYSSSGYSSDWPTFEQSATPAEIKPQEIPQVIPKQKKLSAKGKEFFENIMQNQQSNIPSRQTVENKGIMAYLKGLALLKKQSQKGIKSSTPELSQEISKKIDNPVLSFVKKITTTITQAINNILNTIANLFT